MLDIAVFAAATVAVLVLLAYFQASILLWTVAAGLMLATWAAALTPAAIGTPTTALMIQRSSGAP